MPDLIRQLIIIVIDRLIVWSPWQPLSILSSWQNIHSGNTKAFFFFLKMVFYSHWWRPLIGLFQYPCCSYGYLVVFPQIGRCPFLLRTLCSYFGKFNFMCCIFHTSTAYNQAVICDIFNGFQPVQRLRAAGPAVKTTFLFQALSFKSKGPWAYML